MPKNRFQIFLTFFVTVWIGTAFFLLMPQRDLLTTIPRVENEYLYQVESEEQARMLAKAYHLELQAISAYRIATFVTDETGIEKTLLAAGFTFNGQSHSYIPPWQSTVDPYLSDQYGLEITNTLSAWEIEEGSALVTVAIIDSGIDTTHPEFLGRISALSYNVITDSAGLEHIEDDTGHGTMVAGVIGAIKDNSKGIAGIAQNVALMIIKANNTGEGTFNDNNLVEAIYYAVDHGANIINMSLGGPYANPLTETAIAYAKTHNVIVIAASGNDGITEKNYPASFPDAISVGAIDETKAITTFSNYNDEIDLSAPGAAIVTTAMGSGYASVSGTSFASPHVAGIAALLLSHDPGISYDELRFRLLGTAVDLGAEDRDDYYGFGLVDSLQLLTENFVRIDFETFLGSEMASIWVKPNEAFSVAAIPFLADHVFVGWFQDEALSIPFVENVDSTAVDMTLYAKFTSLYHTVTLISEGLSLEAEVIGHETVYVPDSLLKEGYEFDGWYVDAELSVLYVPGPLLGDLTLYAKWTEIIYYNVDIQVLDAIYDAFEIRSEAIPELPTITVEGYTFAGWYLDDAFSIPYSPGPVLSDFTLYAKMSLIYYQVNLHVEGEDTLTIEVGHNLVPTFPEVTKPDQQFAGWYLDPSYMNQYTNTPIVSDMDLYAKFAENIYAVTIHIPFEIPYPVYVSSGDNLVLVEPEIEGYHFGGWYLDEEYLVPYSDALVTSNFSVYAKMERIWLQVTFFESDLTTPLQTQLVEYGTSGTAPIVPNKPSSPAFDYVFLGWSEDFQTVQTNLEIYPVYEWIFKPESVTLNPGIDTVSQNGTWIDAGVHFTDTLLSVSVSDTIDLLTIGRYIVTYEIIVEAETIATMERIVRVVEEVSNVEITLNKGKTTIIVGENYVDSGATTNIGEVETIAAVDTMTPGVYPVIYRVSLNGWVFEKIRYVHVIANPDLVVTVPIYLIKKEDDIYEI